MMNERIEWLNAVEAFRIDINAEVLCPKCKKSNLLVKDIPFDIKDEKRGGERCLECPNCKKIEFVLYKNPPENWLFKIE